MKHNITLIPGDGIAEIVAATVRTIEATGVEIGWETQLSGRRLWKKYGTTIPTRPSNQSKPTKSRSRTAETPIGKGFTSVTRSAKALDLYATCVDQGAAECSVPLSRTRFDYRSREHRRFIRPDSTRRRSGRGLIIKSSPKRLRRALPATLLNTPSKTAQKVTAMHKAKHYEIV